MKITRIIFWEPSVSPHKHSLLEHLAQLGYEVILCAQVDIQEERVKMGWRVPDSHSYLSYINPTKKMIQELFFEQADSTLNIFSGIRHVPIIVEAIKNAKRHNYNFAIMSEPRVNEGMSGKLRVIQSWFTEAWHRKNAKFICAIGRNGPPWFRLAGYAEEKILPFAYFVDQPTTAISKSETNQLQVGFIGRMTEAKGFAVFVESMRIVNKKIDIHVHLIGDGIMRNDCLCQLSDNKITYTYHGIIPIDEISRSIQILDVVTLPSTTKDGWGVVISEALLAGCYTIVTSCVGASMILNNQYLGLSIEPNDANALADAILKINKTDVLSEQSRNYRKKWANSHLTGEAGARYLDSIIQNTFYKKPVPDFWGA